MAEEPKRQPPVLDGASLAPFTLRDLLLYFLRLGTLGFGGPIALAGYMQRELVEGRRWVSKQDYLEGLAFSPVVSRSVSSTASDVLGVASCRSLWGNAGGHSLHLAVLPDGARIGRSLCSLRQPPLDSRHVLRDWSLGHCDHCAKRNQTGPHHGRERLAPLGNLWIDRPNHSVDQV